MSTFPTPEERAQESDCPGCAEDIVTIDRRAIVAPGGALDDAWDRVLKMYEADRTIPIKTTLQEYLQQTLAKILAVKL